MAYYRQVERAADGDASAVDQLRRAVVLHVDAAWSGLKYDLGCLVTLKCPACGRLGHWRGTYRETAERFSLTCTYGWTTIFTSMWPHLRGALLHGED